MDDGPGGWREGSEEERQNFQLWPEVNNRYSSTTTIWMSGDVLMLRHVKSLWIFALHRGDVLRYIEKNLDWFLKICWELYWDTWRRDYESQRRQQRSQSPKRDQHQREPRWKAQTLRREVVDVPRRARWSEHLLKGKLACSVHPFCDSFEAKAWTLWRRQWPSWRRAWPPCLRCFLTAAGWRLPTVSPW